MIPPVSPPIPRPDLRQQAMKLEAAFLSEMLSHAGLGQTSGAFAGGAGAAQFASFLRDEQVGAIVRQGGFGLAESIHRALERKDG
ncbi:hypothetical protein [Falsirhodobacter halotolerans]|uniref:hypothetical protein n=1 Tax=Falsirhodobacter halotolerans TaxID=1146892 RepID=UPI001FD0CCA9|nr:hypothetical protein [Falsirhodobacter halotolerans]MCJ8140572.1 hypothetical protein [Falsirhodobacter halotolerans]